MTGGTDGEGQGLEKGLPLLIRKGIMEAVTIMAVPHTSERMMIITQDEMKIQGVGAMEIGIEVLRGQEITIGPMQVATKNLGAVSAISVARRDTLLENALKVVETMTEGVVDTSEDRIIIQVEGEKMTAEVVMKDGHSVISEALCMSVINLRQVELNMNLRSGLYGFFRG